jgi:hypothetical protein
LPITTTLNAWAGADVAAGAQADASSNTAINKFTCFMVMQYSREQAQR